MAARQIRTLEIVVAPALQPRELFLQIGRSRYQVASIEQAVAMHNAARDKSEYGASKMPRVTIVNSNGTHLYGISYNGRVWDGDKPLDGMIGDEWLNDGGRKLDAMVAQNKLTIRAAARTI